MNSSPEPGGEAGSSSNGAGRIERHLPFFGLLAVASLPLIWLAGGGQFGPAPVVTERSAAENSDMAYRLCVGQSTGVERLDDKIRDACANATKRRR